MSEVIEKESTELVTLPPQDSALEIYSTAGGLTPLIEQIREKVAGTVYNMTTVKGRDECRSDAAKVGRSKTAIERLGKALSAQYKEIPKKIDAERRRAFDELEALQDEVRLPLTEWEQAEEMRIEGHKRGIQHIIDCGNGLIGGEAQPFGLLFVELESIVVGDSWEEYEAEAHRAKDAALAKLKAEFAEHQKREAEQAELAKLRAEAAAREQKEREERIAREAEERARQAAEAKAQAERDAVAKREADAKAAAERRELELKLQAETAEREKQEAINRAAQEKAAAEERQKLAVEAERKRQADEIAKQEAEAKAREANKQHKASINRAALEAFVAGGMTEDCAKQAVTMIAKGQIPAVRISY